MRSTVWIGLGWSLLGASGLYAQDQRDEDIFGSEPKKESTPAPTTEGSPQALMDTMQIGGRLEVRSSTGQEEQQKLPKANFQQLKTADVYFDTRPNKDLRVFLRTRWTETTPVATPAAPDPRDCASCVDTKLDELWFKWDWDDTVFVTYGKQHLKWGSSRFWNPSDFTAREVRDPLALFDRRLGQELLKIHIPQEKQGHNYYAVVQFDDAARNDDVGLALRGEFSIGQAGELALSAQTRRNSPQRLAVDLSTALGPVDLTVEAASSKRQNRQFFRGDLDPERFQLPESFQDRDKWFKQVVGGLRHTWKYSDEDNVSYGAEYFWNDLGYKDRELELYSLILGESQSLYAGERYAGAYLVLLNPGSWNETSFYLNGLTNLSDDTGLVRATGTWELRDDATFEVYVSRCFGDYGELCFKVPESYRQLAQIPGLPDSLKTTVAQLPTRKITFTAGAALSIEF